MTDYKFLRASGYCYRATHTSAYISSLWPLYSVTENISDYKLIRASGFYYRASTNDYKLIRASGFYYRAHTY